MPAFPFATLAAFSVSFATKNVFVADICPFAQFLSLGRLRVQFFDSCGLRVVLSTEKQKTCRRSNQKFFHVVHAPFDLISNGCCAQILFGFAVNVNR